MVLRKCEIKKNEKIYVGDWRNQTKTRAEPCFGFRVFRWAKLGLPKNLTGGTQILVPPKHKNEIEQVFRG